MLWTIWGVVAAAIVYTALCLMLYAGQRGMMYFPTTETPQALVPGAAVVRLQSGGQTLKIWRIGGGPDAVIYFGGNAEDVAWNIPAFSAAFPGRTVYLANYRGYGGSTGTPSEAGLVGDALALYDHVDGRHPGRQIALIGRSLGSAVAAQVAAARKADKLALITPFDSVLNVARNMFPLFPVSLLLKDRFDTAGRVADISAPVRVIIAGRDRVIPRRRSEALVRAFPAAQVSVRVLEQANHHNISEAAGYAEALAGFVNDSE